MDWLHGQLNEIWGIPQFWIARTAKTLQFIAGTVILLEILGKERVEGIARSVRLLLSKLVEARPLRLIANDLWEGSKYTLLYILFLYLSFLTLGSSTRIERKLSVIESRKYNTKYQIPTFIASVVLGITGVVYGFAADAEFKWDWSLVYIIPQMLMFLTIISYVFIYLVVFNLALLLIYIIFRPLEWVFDCLAHSVIKLMERKSASQLWLILSLCLLVISFILELAAS